MVSYYYQYFYEDDVKYAESQLEFYESKIKKIDNENINENNKVLKKKRIEFIIQCIQYSYGI